MFNSPLRTWQWGLESGCLSESWGSPSWLPPAISISCPLWRGVEDGCSSLSTLAFKDQCTLNQDLGVHPSYRILGKSLSGLAWLEMCQQVQATAAACMKTAIVAPHYSGGRSG